MSGARRACTILEVSEVHSRAVRKAAELLGGRDRLAKALDVPQEEIEKWISGKVTPPHEPFLRVVDIIVDSAAE